MAEVLLDERAGVAGLAALRATALLWRPENYSCSRKGPAEATPCHKTL